VLRDVLRANQHTAFGRDHGFAHLRSVADYRARVPAGDYERMRPYVARLERGEPHVLTHEPPQLLLLTSGTTAAPKHLPLTRAGRRAAAHLTLLWLYRALGDHPALLDGHGLVVVGRSVEGRTPAGLPVGCASGQLYSGAAWLLRHRGVPLAPFWRIPDFDARYYTLLRLAIERDLSFVATPNPSTLLRLFEAGDRAAEDLLRDLHDGTLTPRLAVPAAVRTWLRGRLAPNPARARLLAARAARVGQLGPRAYWPTLRLVGCWKGGSVGTQLSRLQTWLPAATPVRDLGYLASEGQFSLPLADAGASGVLALTAAFYEFVPADAPPTDAPTLLAHQLATGREYAVRLTTPNGLYRYDIHDVVRVTGWHRRTPCIEFVRKTADMASITGEKLHVNHVVEAFRRAEAACPLGLRQFRAVAEATANRYALLVECHAAPPSPERAARFAAEIDTALGALNREYHDKRASGRLDAPVLCLMRPGWGDRSASRHPLPAGRDAQRKAPLLAQAPDPADAADVLFATSAERSKWTEELVQLAPPSISDGYAGTDG
jgi:hypothetical protein